MLLISIYLGCFCNEKKSLHSNSCLTMVLYGSMYGEKLTRFVLETEKLTLLLWSTHITNAWSFFFPLTALSPSLHIFPLDWRRRSGKGNYGGKGEWGGCFLRRVAVFVSWHKWRELFWKRKEKYKKKKDGQRKKRAILFFQVSFWPKWSEVGCRGTT